MKTSNKLLYGFLALILLTITIGFIILKVELKKAGSNEFKNNESVTDTVKVM